MHTKQFLSTLHQETMECPVPCIKIYINNLMQVMLDRWQVTEYTKMCKHLTYLACSTHTHKSSDVYFMLGWPSPHTLPQPSVNETFIQQFPFTYQANHPRLNLVGENACFAPHLSLLCFPALSVWHIVHILKSLLFSKKKKKKKGRAFYIYTQNIPQVRKTAGETLGFEL